LRSRKAVVKAKTINQEANKTTVNSSHDDHPLFALVVGPGASPVLPSTKIAYKCFLAISEIDEFVTRCFLWSAAEDASEVPKE
jgi:hypothetical protein